MILTLYFIYIRDLKFAFTLEYENKINSQFLNQIRQEPFKNPLGGQNNGSLKQGPMSNNNFLPQLNQQKPLPSPTRINPTAGPESKPIYDINNNFLSAVPQLDKIKDPKFAEHVRYNNGVFQDFLNNSPNANHYLKGLLTNYGVLSPNELGESFELSLPDANYIIKVSEEALTVYVSFKEYLRSLLESIEENMSKAEMLIRINVKKAKDKITHLAAINTKLKVATSQSLKDQYEMEKRNVIKNLKELKQRFDKYVEWIRAINTGINKSY